MKQPLPLLFAFAFVFYRPKIFPIPFPIFEKIPRDLCRVGHAVYVTFVVGDQVRVLEVLVCRQGTPRAEAGG